MTSSLSLIIPIYNEAGNIKPLVKKISAGLKSISLKKFEVIFVDDGSTDDSYQKLLQIQKSHSFIKLIKLKRNFGKATAYSAGFSQAKHDVIVTLDGDLQDDPTEVKKFLNKIDQGYDLVVGWKTQGKGTLTKTIVSRVFNQVVAKVFRLGLHDFNCPFKAYRRHVIEGLNIYSGLYRFIPIFAHSLGFKIAEIKISNYPRVSGKSKFGGRRLITGFLDFLTVLFITRFNLRPMHLFGGLAIISALIGTVILSYFTVLSFQGVKVGSRPLFLLGILLEVTSLQFLSMGFIGEMLTRSLVDVKPEHLIEEIKS